ncbi:MAG: serine acetyltransferase [Prevotella sp.]|nr:serine acetyltransferase [Prevotella sp.]
MKDIAIYGAGGLGKEIAALVHRINAVEARWNLVGFIDDGKEKGDRVSHFGTVLGGMEVLSTWESPLDIAIAIGTPNTLKTIREKITNPNISFPNVISPTMKYIDIETFSIGEGNIIQDGCWASTDVTIGNYNILNGEVVLGHDVTVGDYNVLMPDIRLSGEVTVGECNLIGVGSIIVQQIRIGENVTIGPGAVLLTKPKNGNTYIGNPAKLFKF